jgi:hypothetical protein
MLEINEIGVDTPRYVGLFFVNKIILAYTHCHVHSLCGIYICVPAKVADISACGFPGSNPTWILRGTCSSVSVSFPRGSFTSQGWMWKDPSCKTRWTWEF